MDIEGADVVKEVRNDCEHRLGADHELSGEGARAASFRAVLTAAQV